MKDRRHITWLNEELPGLVGRGVLTPEAAEQVRQHYGAVPADAGKRVALVLFGILGGLLIGGGIILLLAHNWADLTRPVRTALSFVPLLLGVGLGGFVVLQRRQSAAWGEGAGTFWALSIGASIALVAQTYHISGDFAAFMLTWSLAGLPIVYLLRSTTTTILYWIGITTWAGSLTWRNETALWFWPLAALAVPHLWRLVRGDRYQMRVGWLVWTLAVCGAFGIGFGLARDFDDFWIPTFTGYFAVLYLVGARWFDEGRTFWQRPFQTIGALGVMVLAVLLTFEDAWDTGWWPGRWSNAPEAWLGLLVLAAWPLAAVGLWGEAWRRREPVTLLFGSLPVMALLGGSLAAANAGLVMLIVMNLYTLGLGVALIAFGVREHRLGVVNLGLLLTSVLIVARFFDSDLSFVLRGVAFIAIGIGFLVTNVVLIRKGRGAT